MIQRSNAILRLHDVISNTAPIHGVAAEGDGFRIEFTEEATVEQVAEAKGLLENFNPDDLESQAEWEKSRARSAASSGLIENSDSLSVGIRVMLRIICDRFNQLAHHSGRDDLVIVEPDIFLDAHTALLAGLGDPGVRQDIE